ncbi:hypothetical protein IW261DRAFT_1503363 [Armillaria novae-zelandiae]|uniref:Uncharacterized protein n=1 Tax=Armillaria novae-zelandiae TaxID=153914 RepID=A0AA39TYU4_9AGAR|nr:hypothetical protein IW261DRAFT_1503363 [Armillaria novae-zelandiae]
MMGSFWEERRERSVLSDENGFGWRWRWRLDVWLGMLGKVFFAHHNAEQDLEHCHHFRRRDVLPVIFAKAFFSQHSPPLCFGSFAERFLETKTLDLPPVVSGEERIRLDGVECFAVRGRFGYVPGCMKVLPRCTNLFSLGGHRRRRGWGLNEWLPRVGVFNRRRVFGLLNLVLEGGYAVLGGRQPLEGNECGRLTRHDIGDVSRRTFCSLAPLLGASHLAASHAALSSIFVILRMKVVYLDVHSIVSTVWNG